MIKYEVIEEDKYNKVYIFGDIHGDYDSLIDLWNKIPEADKENELIIFLGDYTDRGPKQYEVFQFINNLLDKDNIKIIKGNHEDFTDNGSPKFMPFDFYYHIEKEYPNFIDFFNKTYKPFTEKLYHYVIVENHLFCVHAGIPSSIDLEKADFDEILWNDPSDNIDDFERNYSRGIGCYWGIEATLKFLLSNNLEYIVRSHEPRKCKNGIHYQHNNNVLTVNSNKIYGTKAFVTVYNIKEQSFKEIFTD